MARQHGPDKRLRLRRRDLIALLGGAAAFPRVVHADQLKMPVVGVVNLNGAAAAKPLMMAFAKSLEQSGFIDGSSVAIEYRFADGHFERCAALVDGLVASHVALIVTGGGTAVTQLAKTATKTIPIVFHAGDDPVGAGVVDSLSHPGGNLTGVLTLIIELEPKRLQLLHDLLPNVRSVGAVVSPRFAITGIADAATRLGLALQAVTVASEGELDGAFATLAGARVGAVFIGGGAEFNTWRERIAILAARHALPTVSNQREFCDAGGLASYGADIVDAYRQVGLYAARILKGEKPAELPVIQAERFQLVINLKTAKALGLAIPPTLLARADEVIE